jgi:hypothetical protein
MEFHGTKENEIIIYLSFLQIMSGMYFPCLHFNTSSLHIFSYWWEGCGYVQEI